MSAGKTMTEKKSISEKKPQIEESAEYVLPPGERPGVIEVIVRGVYVRDGRILLCKSRNSPLTYLPGGHVEFREKATHALAREVLEEMGRKAKVGRFLGFAENTFVQKGEWHAEVFSVFEMEVAGLSPADMPESAESWVEFLWWPLDKLDRSRLEPAALRRCLRDWLEPGAQVADAIATTRGGWLDVAPEHD